MMRYVLDTNHVGEAISRVSVVRDRIQQSRRRGTVFGVCGPVLCEVMVGVVQRKDVVGSRRRLDRLLQVVRIWPVDLAVAERFARVYHELQKSGRAMSQVDMMVAAMARCFDAAVLTADQDFQALQDIPTENWLLA